MTCMSKITALLARYGQTAQPSVPDHLIERLHKHCEDKANTAFARSTMREAMQYLGAPTPPANGQEQQDNTGQCTCGKIFGVHIGKVPFPKPAKTEKTKSGRVKHWYASNQLEHFAVQMVHSDRITNSLEYKRLSMMVEEIRMAIGGAFVGESDTDIVEYIRTLHRQATGQQHE